MDRRWQRPGKSMQPGKKQRFFGAGRAERTVFTSNATEALNIAIEGAIKPGMHVITTEAEHNSVLRPLYRKARKGVKLTIVKADNKGRILAEDIEKAICPETSWLFCTHAPSSREIYLLL